MRAFQPKSNLCPCKLMHYKKPVPIKFMKKHGLERTLLGVLPVCHEGWHKSSVL